MHLPSPFGKYELLERIATGGMAEVFLARSFGAAGFEKRLVIKRIRPELDGNPRFIQMFINEAKIGVHLNHPNVVQLYELGKVDGSYYIAMEHLNGRDLTRLVKTLRAEGRRLPIEVAVFVVAEICRGLSHAHGLSDSKGQTLGLVHRDVSPHNILVTFAGDVKLVDFGIARVMHTALGETIPTVPSAAGPLPGGGKYAYMSPEQALGQEVDHRTDIFSAGIVLWELIVGHRLFQHANPGEKLRRVQQAVIPHPRTEGVEIDDMLWGAIQRALARETSDRTPTAAVFEEDLRAWLFERRSRVGRAELVEVMAEVFPQEARLGYDDLDVRRLVAELDRLDPRDRTVTHTPSYATPAGGVPLPGRLRPSVGERKQVSAMIIDVDGLTDLSASVQPEALFKRHYQVLRWLRRVVDRHGGVIQRAIDDQILVLFGVPRTRPGDLARCIECAMQIQSRCEDLARILGVSVALAIGIHTGEVTVGMVRHRIRYDARGDTTRLARRLSARADHGEVLVSEQVLQSVGGIFRLRGGRQIPNRGGKPPTPAYLVEGRRTGVRVAASGPWLRRGLELAVLKEALVHVGRGTGRTLFLAGDVGTGKSRLLREIRELARRRGIPFYAGNCSSVRATEAPAQEIMREVLGLGSDVPVSERRDRAERLAQLGLERGEIEVVMWLIGVPMSDSPAKEDVWRALGRVVGGLAHEGPLIVALDDVHHFTIPEQRALARLVTDTRGPVLFLLSRRDPLDSELRAVGEEVLLGAFAIGSQHRLVRELVQAEFVEDSLISLIEGTCEGNPLYIEEMVKYLVQEGRLVVEEGRARLSDLPDPSAMPPTLAGLVSARIDALDPASKGILQLAAVAGDRFQTAVVAEAAGVDDPTPLIADLAHHGLIRRHTPRTGQWSFASVLVREAALRGSLGVQRRSYHRMVAGAIETIHADALEEYHESLAQHCAEGGRPLDAARYAFKAGEQWEKRQYLERARASYQLGLSCIEAAGDNPDDWDMRTQGEAMLQQRLGTVDLLLGDIRSGEGRLQIALDIASDASLPWIEIGAHLELGKSYLQRGRYVLAKAHLQQVAALVSLEEDPALEREATEALANLAHEEGRNTDAEKLWQDALGLAKEDPAAVARCQLGLASRYLRGGDLDRAGPLLDEALQSTRVAGDRILEGRVLNNIGLMHSWSGDLESALAMFRKALEVRTGIGYTRGVVINHHNIGDVHFSRGDWGRAWVAFERSRELALEMGWDRGAVLNDVYLGYLKAKRGNEDEGLAQMKEAVAQARTLGDLEITTSGRWLTARWMAECGRVDRARDEVSVALEDARKYGLSGMVEVLEELNTVLQEGAGA